MTQIKYLRWTPGKVLFIHIMIWDAPSVHHHDAMIAHLCNSNLTILINSENMAKNVSNVICQLEAYVIWNVKSYHCSDYYKIDTCKISVGAQLNLPSAE